MKHFGSKASTSITTALSLLAATGLSLLLTACGGGGNTTRTGPPVAVLTVASVNPASGVAITVSPADDTGQASGSTQFTRTYSVGTSVTLTAPSTSGSNSFSLWSGCTSISSTTCTVLLNAATTVTAKYTVPVAGAPTVTVTPSPSSINTTQALAVTVAVAGNTGESTPTGSVTLSGSGYTSAASSLSGGSATINIPAGTFTTAGSVTLTASYTPDSGSSSTYTSATGTGSVTVTTATPTYTLTVNSASPSSGVAIIVSPVDINSLGNGGTSFTRTYNSGTVVTLTAPASSGSSTTFSSWTGCTAAAATVCTVTLGANTTVTANYSATVPTVTVMPAVGSVTTAQNLRVNVTVAGTPAPTGSIVLSSGTYTSASTPLTTGSGSSSASIQILAGQLATGTDTLTATYTPDAQSSSLYASATGTASVIVTPPSTFALTIDSTNPTSGVTITSNTTDINGHSTGTTPFTLVYNTGQAVILTAPSSSGTDSFTSWTGGCSSTTTACSVTVSAATTVSANYGLLVGVTPNPATATVGNTLQFSATINGTSSSAVTWSVSSTSGSPGTISSTGLYTTPYPAPATVTVKATSTADTSDSASVTVTLSPPTAGVGPALTVDATDQTRAISPLIYGMNGYLLDTTTAQNANITVARWGGDDTSRFNYQNGNSNSASDYYFQNSSSSYGMLPSGGSGSGSFNTFIATANSLGIKTIGTAPVLGYVASSSTSACSFPQSTYPGQQSYNPSNCGNGVYPNGTHGCTSANGCSFSGNATTWQTTSLQETPPTPPASASDATTAWADATWTGSWVKCLLSTGPSCTAAAGKDATIWDLDNEPAWWDAVHRDVHPNPSTYDEVTDGGIGTALAIKTEDPAALTAGPVIDYWWNYFYSKKDIESGWSSGSPCYQPWSNPVDRNAHGGVPMIVYYLQQMAAASTTYNVRLLDFLTIHSYSAATYNGSSVGLTTAGNTAEQEARMDSTRALWDPTYTDPNFPQPNYTTDPNYTASCTTPLQSPQIIPMMQSWITAGWTGTSFAAPGTSIDEYNFGGNESINGAVTQADVLGIFGKYGLTMATLWPTTNFNQQVPGNMAFAIYRNYDGNDSVFGDEELDSSSADQGKLSVYAALRTNNTLTIVVINKTYGDLSSTLTLDNLTTAHTAHAYRYSNANLNAIVAQPDVTIAPGSTNSTLTSTFPAQSITLLVIPE